MTELRGQFRARRLLRIMREEKHAAKLLAEANKLGLTKRQYKNKLENMAVLEGVSKKALKH